jgi:hypothetical protein
MDAIRYPIGMFIPIDNPTNDDRERTSEQIRQLTKSLRSMLMGLDHEQLNTPYRQDGWSVRQIVHHLADNDMNAYSRLKRALTEEEPLAGSYREDLWAELHDYKDLPVENSLLLLETLHQRLLILLQGLEPQHYYRTLRTQLLGVITIDTAIQRFVWHNHHHMAQITSLLQRKGWSG